MIFIMSEKQFLKDKKKLVVPKDYIIVNSTNDDRSELTKFNMCTTVDAFDPPEKLIRLIEKNDDDDLFDMDKLKKIEDKFFKGEDFIQSAMAVTKGVIDKNINAFIILRNKKYKLYGKKIKKAIQKVFKAADVEFVHLYKDFSDNKKELSTKLSSSQISELRDALEDLEKKLSKKSKSKDSDKKKDKKKDKDKDKKKKKDKDKDKKKKKKKKKDDDVFLSFY